MNDKMTDINDARNLLTELKNMSASFKNFKANQNKIEQSILGFSDYESEEEIVDDRYDYIVLDLETTTYKEIIQVAYTIYDVSFKKIKHVDVLMNEGIGKIDHYKKFTLDDIFTYGKDPVDVLLELVNDLQMCKYLVCHNIAFDAGLIYKYLLKYDIQIINKPTNVCTMKLARKFCNKKDKRGWLKAPSLSELYYKCFNEYPDETKTHSADYDIAITKRCFRYLIENNIINLNKIK